MDNKFMIQSSNIEHKLNKKNMWLSVKNGIPCKYIIGMKESSCGLLAWAHGFFPGAVTCWALWAMTPMSWTCQWSAGGCGMHITHYPFGNPPQSAFCPLNQSYRFRHTGNYQDPVSVRQKSWLYYPLLLTVRVWASPFLSYNYKYWHIVPSLNFSTSFF